MTEGNPSDPLEAAPLLVGRSDISRTRYYPTGYAKCGTCAQLAAVTVTTETERRAQLLRRRRDIARGAERDTLNTELAFVLAELHSAQRRSPTRGKAPRYPRRKSARAHLSRSFREGYDL